MQSHDSPLTLDTVINFLTLYINNLKLLNTNDKDIIELVYFFEWCLKYLVLYKGSVTSMECIKNALEVLALKKIDVDMPRQ